MMNGPQKVYRETCEHCQYKDLPNGCEGCLAGIAYECEDERRSRIYYTEVAHLRELPHPTAPQKAQRHEERSQAVGKIIKKELAEKASSRQRKIYLTCMITEREEKCNEKTGS